MANSKSSKPKKQAQNSPAKPETPQAEDIKDSVTRNSEDCSQNASLLMDAWKHTVNVQMHFNEVEMKIRGLAITLLVGLFGAVALTLKIDSTAKGLSFRVFGEEAHLSLLLTVIAITSWGAFYFMERFWYHKLLYGSVEQGMNIEKELSKIIPTVQLTNLIGKQSAVKVPFTPLEISSRQKIDLYYIGIPLLSVCSFKILLLFGALYAILFVFVAGYLGLILFGCIGLMDKKKPKESTPQIEKAEKLLTTKQHIGLVLLTWLTVAACIWFILFAPHKSSQTQKIQNPASIETQNVTRPVTTPPNKTNQKDLPKQGQYPVSNNFHPQHPKKTSP